ncbi:PREDICTED: probable plastid-lipid-associated protein 8, chloroplastic [Tarenaya hassleriana]|uniref:probable plastid-lipid-associated protein 8, chloroplastic n=1 Tax=Tarenaya hassleriana TaxID=28532 RepID=UPI00053C4C9C|nr:PREDICTED: probable plastid-lipid-associated protein 8, chloroplastic [Tarenaya hassleriana]
MASAAPSLAISSSFSDFRTQVHSSNRPNLPFSASVPCKNHSQSQRRLRLPVVVGSVSTPNAELRTGPDDLVSSILSKVANSDGGVTLSKDQHKEVTQVAKELQKYCVDEPVKCPLIFGEWDVVYCSRPTSPGGGYRSMLGRLVFRTKEMIQAIEAPDIVRNKVAFSAFGSLEGEVSLKGKLKVMDSEWVQVIFEPPELKVGALEFRYGFESEVKLRITYIDDKLRLGIGSRGSLFVFRRRQ